MPVHVVEKLNKIGMQIAPFCTVHFDDVDRSRFLMKQVYVLCNDGMDMTFSFKLGQCSVRLVGFCIEDLTRQGAEPCIEFTRVCSEGV